MHTHKILNLHRQDSANQELFGRQLNISNILAQLLLNRGVNTVQDAESFLRTKVSQFLNPFLFEDMKTAVCLVKKAAADKKTVLIAGDYDVDGVTSVALLKNTFKKSGVNAIHYIPHRVNDGYGLNKKAVKLAKEKAVGLVITADCGISSFEEVRELADSNIDVIITDHHEPAGEGLPCAGAIINPKVKGCSYKFKDLAGVGVAYKFCQALTGSVLADELDIVSLGTIADVVPLFGENRVIAKEGLSMMTQAKRTGIKALIDSSRINGKSISSTFVSYILAPRINASGRIDTAETALSLLLSEDRKEADMLAQSLENLNRQRQKIEGRIMEEAQQIINSEIDFKEDKVIVVAKEGWHHGVLGVVASKLADKFYRPTIVISLEEGLCKGSGRSIRNFHLFHALSDCSARLVSYGGHAHAVGLLVQKDNIKNFRNDINMLADNRLKVEDLLPVIDIDMELQLSEVTERLAHDIKALEPFGAGNPEPLFLTRNLRLKGQPQVLARETLKFFCSDGMKTIAVIGFGMADLKDSLINCDSFDLVYFPKIDNWAQEDLLILQAEDIFFK